MPRIVQTFTQMNGSKVNNVCILTGTYYDLEGKLLKDRHLRLEVPEGGVFIFKPNELANLITKAEKELGLAVKKTKKGGNA